MPLLIFFFRPAAKPSSVLLGIHISNTKSYIFEGIVLVSYRKSSEYFEPTLIHWMRFSESSYHYSLARSCLFCEYFQYRLISKKTLYNIRTSSPRIIVQYRNFDTIMWVQEVRMYISKLLFVWLYYPNFQFSKLALVMVGDKITSRLIPRYSAHFPGTIQLLKRILYLWGRT